MLRADEQVRQAAILAEKWRMLEMEKRKAETEAARAALEEEMARVSARGRRGISQGMVKAAESCSASGCLTCALPPLSSSAAAERHRGPGFRAGS